MREEFSPLFSRRGHERFPLTGQAQITTKVAHGISSLVADISSRGASVVTTIPFEKNEQLQVLLHPCALFSSLIRRQARVAWCTKIQDNLWQAGLDFGIDNLIYFA